MGTVGVTRVAPLGGVLLCGVGVLVTMPGWVVLGIVGAAFAASAANRGRYFRYPVCVRLQS